MDAAEDDVFRLSLACGLLREQVRISLEVGVLDDLLPLIVVPKDDDFRPKLLPRIVDAAVKFVGVQSEVLERDLLPPDVDP